MDGGGLMGSIIAWLLDDKQANLFELLVALGLNVLLLLLSTLVLWPLDRLRLAADLARGYGVLWLALLVTTGLLVGIQHLFRLNPYEHVNAYVLSALLFSCCLQVGWAAFAALTVRNYAADAAIWTGVLVHLVGGLSCLGAFFVVGAIYQGAIYRLVSLPVTVVGFLIFSVWPGSARMLYGWFLQLI